MREGQRPLEGVGREEGRRGFGAVAAAAGRGEGGEGPFGVEEEEDAGGEEDAGDEDSEEKDSEAEGHWGAGRHDELGGCGRGPPDVEVWCGGKHCARVEGVLGRVALLGIVLQSWQLFESGLVRWTGPAQSASGWRCHLAMVLFSEELFTYIALCAGQPIPPGCSDQILRVESPVCLCKWKLLHKELIALIRGITCIWPHIFARTIRDRIERKIVGCNGHFG